MSDASKAEKLAAARKKLKEFQSQQRNKGNKTNPALQIQPSIPTCDLIISSNEEVLPSAVSEDKENIFNVPVFSTAQTQPSLSNYFQNSNRNEFFFDTAYKPINGDTDTNIEPFTPSRIEIPSASSFFSLSPDDCNFPPSETTTSAREEEISYKDANEASEKELSTLKMELQIANNKIKMQNDALDIITAEREDLQTKLTKALQEIYSYKANVESLSSQLESSVACQKQLEVAVNELKTNKENLASKESAIEQNLNDLKEKNEELYQNLQIEQQKNKTLGNQLEETQSNYSLLSLKFQQLGIEVNNDHCNDYKPIKEEYELLKRKYAELEERLKIMVFEKEHTNGEYRQYVANLKEELENTNDELRRVTEDNEMLSNKISSQTEHISTLEKQLQKVPGGVDKDAVISQLREEIQALQKQKENEGKLNKELVSQLNDYEACKKRIYELEYEIENLKSDMTDAGELQKAVESNKVAASQAISQNAKLKNEFEQLHQMVQVLSEEKVMLSKMLEEERMKNEKLTMAPDNNDKTESHEVTTNDAAINTDDGEDGRNNIHGKANVEAMMQLQEKFKSVLDKMADLTDEKQQLEHLVLQLQCETETIEEYVALYQKQRSVLQQRARETDLKMERVSQEKERLLNIIRSILSTDEFDCTYVKQLVENNLSVELSDELENTSSEFLPKNEKHEKHHPSCSCCQGQLITI